GGNARRPDRRLGRPAERCHRTGARSLRDEERAGLPTGLTVQLILLPLREKVAAEGRRMRGFAVGGETPHPTSFHSAAFSRKGRRVESSSRINPASSSNRATTGQDTIRARHSGGRRTQSFSVVTSPASNSAAR